MLYKIIVVNGTARSGKDTFVALCDRYWRDIKHAYCIMHSTVGYIKEMLEEYYGISEEPKTDRKRALWCDIKKLLTDYGDYPFKAIQKIVRENDWNNGAENLLFIMAREPKEIAKIKAEWPGLTVTVLVSKAVDIPANYADANVWNYQYDYIIDNNGSIEDLDVEAKKFCALIRKK